jgi:hypothetical protein
MPNGSYFYTKTGRKKEKKNIGIECSLKHFFE